MTPIEWAAKADNEGGLYDAVTGYGLTHEDLDRADDPSFYDAVKEFVERARKLEPYADEVNSYIEDFDYSEYE